NVVTNLRSEMKKLISSIKSIFKKPEKEVIKSKTQESITPEMEFEKLRNKLVSLALQIGKSYNYNLDYSENSIKNVESILSEFHEDYKETGNEEGLLGISYEFGLYIVGVIEKNHGKGILKKDHKDFGENSYPFYWNEGTIFPCSWCYKRIFDGESDNVWTKYETFVIGKK
ncbi:hypothetical protein, partial [uncultured Polaribacter sp.]|uniref:hypothetical protein n=1 Tax=uncultured Polaribacter sp. TaxID=174711 RepID=UPI00262F58D7